VLSASPALEYLVMLPAAQSAAKEKMDSLPKVFSGAEGVLSLAADPELTENSRLGFRLQNQTLHQGFELRNSTTALGIPGTLALEGVWKNDRARYYDPTLGRFISEDPAWFDTDINFYTYVKNGPVKFTDPAGLYTTEPDVPTPLPPALDTFMKCMDGCTGREQHVTATTNGKHSDPGHAAGTTVDVRPIGTPSKTIFCCAGKCGAAYGLDERPGYSQNGVRTKHGGGAHFHLQQVAPLHPSPKAPNSIPDTPECKPGKCDAKNDGKK
jgi:RHS repeat-associated protein